MKYKYSGYGIYLEEMERLEQVGMRSKWKDRKLEGESNVEASKPRTTIPRRERTETVDQD